MAQIFPTQFQHKKLAELIRNEDGRYNFVCYDCGAYFDSGSNIIQHIEDVHLTAQLDVNHQKYHLCTNCNASFKFKGDLKKHMLTLHKILYEPETNVRNVAKLRTEKNAGLFECEYCGQTYTQQFRLDLHAKGHHILKKAGSDNRRGVFDCGQCDRSFKCETSLNVHINCAHKRAISDSEYDLVKTFECFDRNSNPLYTDETITDTVQCQFCDQQFPPEFKFELHLRKHIEEIADKRPYKCERCDKTVTFIGHALLKQHFALAHAKIDTSYKCKRCNKEIWEYATFLRHVDEHDAPKLPTTFECYVCRKQFHRKKNLLAHAYVHSDERKYRCTYCAFASKARTTLNQHIRNIHIKNPADYRYRCSICSETFQYGRLHTRHMQQHSGPKPFQCSICGLAFNASGALTKHTRERHFPTTYPCPKCEKIFRKLGRMRHHLRTHRT